MKKVLLIIFVFSYISQNTIAQNYAKIDVALQQEMTLRDSSDLIRINIILNQQYDQMEMRSKSSVYRTKEDKRSFVISELKRFSEETQLGIMELLSTMTDVSEIQSFNLHYSKKIDSSFHYVPIGMTAYCWVLV